LKAVDSVLNPCFRWCSQGGQIYLCDFCPKAFCNQCLKWNLGRKYIKRIEEEEKWKCLACDPTDIRPARADYYAIHKYHKDRAAKTNNGKVGKVNGGSPGRAARPHTVPLGRPVGGSAARPVMAGRGGGKPPRGAAVVRPGTAAAAHLVPNGRLAPAMPGAAYRKHFVDAMLLEADRASNRFRSVINEIRRSWYTAARDETTVTLATRKIREAIVSAHAQLDTTDRKVIDIYRSNVEEADVRDIEPAAGGGGGEEEGVRLMREEEIFAKSELVDTNGIESLETTPDLPFRKAKH
jgi:hypothetical protein